jgi:hypothetical protein
MVPTFYFTTRGCQHWVTATHRVGLVDPVVAVEVEAQQEAVGVGERRAATVGVCAGFRYQCCVHSAWHSCIAFVAERYRLK